MKASHLVWTLRLGGLALLAGAWEVGAQLRASPLTFPPVSQVLKALVQLLGTGEFWQSVFLTLPSLALGLGTAIVLGIPLGLWLGASRLASRLLEQYLYLWQAIPVSPLIPLVIALFGVNLTARAALVFAFSLPVLSLNTIAGVREVPASLLEMARSFGARQHQIYRKVILPAAVPAIMAGLRLAAGRAVIGMVTAELILMSVGLGKLITRFSGTYRSAELYAVVLFILILGVSVVKVVQALEGRWLRWRTGVR